MQRSVYLIAAAIFLLIFFGIVLYNKPLSGPEGQPSKSPTPVLSPTGNVMPTQDPSENIVISSPKPNDSVQFPIIISGSARVFENQLNYRIVDGEGNALSEGNTYANAPDVGQFGPFTITIQNLGDFTSGDIRVEVFDYSAKDGSEIDKVTVPISLK